MKETTVEPRDVVRQRIAMWEGRGTTSTSVSTTNRPHKSLQLKKTSRDTSDDSSDSDLLSPRSETSDGKTGVAQENNRNMSMGSYFDQSNVFTKSSSSMLFSERLMLNDQVTDKYSIGIGDNTTDQTDNSSINSFLEPLSDVGKGDVDLVSTHSNGHGVHRQFDSIVHEEESQSNGDVILQQIDDLESVNNESVHSNIMESSQNHVTSVINSNMEELQRDESLIYKSGHDSNPELLENNGSFLRNNSESRENGSPESNENLSPESHENGSPNHPSLSSSTPNGRRSHTPDFESIRSLPDKIERYSTGGSNVSSRRSSCSNSTTETLEDYLVKGKIPSLNSVPIRNNAVKKYWHQKALKLEVELKDEKVSSLRRELDDLTFTGKAEEEVAALKKAKHDLELRVKDQEEELDDLAGQVQMLEAAKVRLEMSIEQTRKENRRESSQRDEELEEVRIAAQKKIKSLEAQLENEHEERTQLVREKHELERRVVEAMDRNISTVDEESHHRLKKELKKTKALLKDTQTMLEKTQSEGSNKLMLRQLKTQLEDAEFAKTAAIKARQSADADLSDIQAQLDEVLRNKKDAEDRCARMTKEKAELQTQLEESEEEVAEVMKKYKATVSQLSVDQITLSEQSHYIAELEHDKQVLQERQAELSSKVEVLEGETANIHTQRRLEMKIKEMESKLELEQTTRQRLESQITRLKDQVERLSNEVDAARHKETQAMDHSKKLSRQLREAKEDHSNMLQKHTDATNKKQEIEKQLELSEAEIITLKSDLKLAFKRIEDLQQALQGDVSDSDSDISDSDSDSDTSLSSYLTASIRNQRSTSNSTLRTPPSEIILDRGESGLSPGSEAMSVISEDLEENPPTPPATSPPAESFA